MLFNVFDADGNDFHFAPTALLHIYVIVKSRLFQRKPVLQLPCSSVQTISFTPLQDMLPFSDLLLCSGLPLKLEDLLAEVRKHVRSDGLHDGCSHVSSRPFHLLPPRQRV
jgi:hypothetical protein